ncbi:sensor histidine kinase [Streptococcus tangpeifui]|uniref:sensor histidine kinase n=1 Tax=Streptococcus tangpeifui TaxID=2709400 RepID=UPI0013EC49DB|nr:MULTISPECIES: HAMP domain-containing sensor histidine kinase [unclassified Streptococcus]
MKRKSVLKLFIADCAPLFFMSFLTQVVFFGLLFYLKGIWLEEIFYFSFLVFVILLILFIIRFYKRGRVYEKLLLKSDSLSDYLIQKPRSSFEESFNLMVDNLIMNNNLREIEQKQDKKLQKVMIYRFVHQIKTPLSVLRLTSENLHDTVHYQKIRRNISTIEYDLNQMLDIYRLDDFKNDFVSEKVFLKELCRDTINGLKDYFIASQIYPKLDIDDTIYVYSDSKWLKLVIHQLLTNAIKYSHKGQTVTIRAKREEDKVLLSIMDDGTGIERADLKNIFDLFYVGKNGRNTADSSGIGLYIVKRVVEHLGHDVEVDSKVDEGTTITVRF